MRCGQREWEDFWGTNLPMTRTPDAHFFTEARYRGAKVAAVAPDYAEYVKFADIWLPARAGNDAALAMAMSHVILREFYIERQSGYFNAYAKTYTDLPFVVVLEKHGDDWVSGRFVVPNGGWELKGGRLTLKAGGKARRLAGIFHNPDLPTIDEYYEPWTYDYEKLIDSPKKNHQPSLRPRSQLNDASMEITWGPNREDDLAGVTETGGGDVNYRGLDYAAYLQFKRVFMLYLPRLCEHCLNPACGLLPFRRPLQARGRRDRARGPRALPRVAVLRFRLPLQENLFQLEDGPGREVPLLLSAHRGRALAGLLALYQRSRFEPAVKELPDFLPLMLEFFSVAPQAAEDPLMSRCLGAVPILLAQIAQSPSMYAAPLEMLARIQPEAAGAGDLDASDRLSAAVEE